MKTGSKEIRFSLHGYTTRRPSNKVKIFCEGREVEISRESAKALNLI